MKCRECDREYHCCSNCDIGGIEWMADGFCSAQCYYQWSEQTISDLGIELAELRDQISERDDAITALKEEIACMQDEMRDEIARAKDCGFEAGRRGGWF